MRIRNLALVLALAGTTLTAAALYAAPTTSPSTDTAEIQHLRAARKNLNMAKDAFERDPADAANHRQEILQGIDKAIASVDLEIAELKKMEK